MKHPGLERKQFFMDDGLLYGTPQALKWSLDLIEKLVSVSGLKLKWSKMSVHAPNLIVLNLAVNTSQMSRLLWTRR